MSSGNVFAVNRLGYLGPICDDAWGSIQATVVCRQLGFISGVAKTDSFFGDVPNTLPWMILIMPEMKTLFNSAHIILQTTVVTLRVQG